MEGRNTPSKHVMPAWNSRYAHRLPVAWTLAITVPATPRGRLALARVGQMFPELRTRRLAIRPMRPDDLDPLLERRNDPAVARLQAWATPYPRERAEKVVTDTLAMDGPIDGQWFMVTVVEPTADEVVGDLVVHLTNESRTAEVGYSLSSGHWGKGYATEALEAFVEWILDTLPVTRLAGMLHPDNRASAMVLERTGFLFEGHTRLSFWLGD